MELFIVLYILSKKNLKLWHTLNSFIKYECAVLLTFPLSLCLFNRNLENLSLAEWLLPGGILGGDGLLEDSFFLWKKSETAWIILFRRSRSLDFFLVSFAPSLCVKHTMESGSKWKCVLGKTKKFNIITNKETKHIQQKAKKNQNRIYKT